MASYFISSKQFDCRNFEEQIIFSEIKALCHSSQMIEKIGGNNIYLSSVDSIIDQFVKVNSMYEPSKSSPIIHFIIYFSAKYDDVNINQADYIAQEFCKFLNQYQVLYVISNKSVKHTALHFIINTRNLENGEVLKLNSNIEQIFCLQIAFILSNPHLWKGKNIVKLVQHGSSPENMNYFN